MTNESENKNKKYDAEDYTEIGICDYGLVCDQNIPTPLNEYGICQECQEQWEYENEIFPLEEGHNLTKADALEQIKRLRQRHRLE
jgi:hypothetical protein